jgi:hypothetical protein
MFLGVAVLLLSVSAVADDIGLALTPSNGNIVGAAGSVIGWGYTITNNTTQWIQTESISSDPFLNGIPDLVFDFPAVAPGSSVTLDFSPVASGSCAAPPCGLYSLMWDATAPSGFVNAGTFIISSDFYSGNPNNGGIDLGPAPDASAAYTATVGPVPEPTSLLLIASALGVLGWRGRQA